MPRKISAVLFDMDGLLLDTEQVVLDCFRQTCAGLGLSDMDHVLYQCIGLRRADSRLVLERATSYVQPAVNCHLVTVGGTRRASSKNIKILNLT